MPNRLDLPAGFRWGASTAAYQIEGAVDEDGRGPSVWDVFAARLGAVRDGATGRVACDHYHRWPEDVELMRGLGLDGYRFSIAWSRVLPAGAGAVNVGGLDFYDRLVDGLLADGITPMPTLFHWDLPQALEDGGGWLARDTAYRFAEYAELVVDRLGDRVPAWITLNEPFVHMVFGYALGIHAPGRTLMLDALPAAHHQLLGHGLAAAVLRERGHEVMIANNLTPVWPASEAEADVAAAAAYDALHNRLFTDPLLLGSYPDLSAYGVGEDLGGCVRPGDLKLIAGPGLDGLGVNYYNPTRIAAPTEPGGLPFVEAEIEECREPRSAGRWFRTDCASCWSACGTGTGRHCRRSPSPRTAARSRTSPVPTAPSTTSRASTSWPATSTPSPQRSPKAWMSGATSPGRCSTISSGRRATSSDSVWCTSTSRRRCARRRPPMPGTAI